MVGVLFEGTVAVDSSAIIALLDPTDQFHREAREFFASSHELDLRALNATTHEIFTRIRYNRSSSLQRAIDGYDFVRANPFRIIRFEEQDEVSARSLLGKYKDQTLSYHDALCAAVMLRHGIFKIFSFDRDFRLFGFEVLPGWTR